MTRAAPIEYVQKGMGKDTSRVAANRAVALVIAGITARLQHDKAIRLSGFGAAPVIERKVRFGTNPDMRERLNIKQSRAVRLAVAEDLRSGI